MTTPAAGRDGLRIALDRFIRSADRWDICDRVVAGLLAKAVEDFLASTPQPPRAQQGHGEAVAWQIRTHSPGEGWSMWVDADARAVNLFSDPYYDGKVQLRALYTFPAPTEAVPVVDEAKVRDWTLDDVERLHDAMHTLPGFSRDCTLPSGEKLLAALRVAFPAGVAVPGER